MVLQPDALNVDSNTRGPTPIRIIPDEPGGAQPKKFAAVASATTLAEGTPVAFNDSLDAWVAWDPNTGIDSAVNEVQELNIPANADGGTFALVFDGAVSAPIAFNATAAAIETAFEALATVGAGNGTIAGSAGGPFTITFTGALAGAGQNLVEVDGSLLTDGGDAAGGATVTRLTAGSAAGEQDEIQTVTITGTPTGGTFTLTFDGEETAAIAYDANAAAVQSALEALSNIGSGGVVCAGGALPGTPVTVTFSGAAFTDSDVPLLVANGALLTGGTDPAVSVVETQEGSDGTGAPASLIRGFVYSKDAELSTAGETIHVVMQKGQIHFDDIPLPTAGSPTSAQLKDALRDGMVEKGLFIQGLSNVR